ncbi:hypothetical protein PG991_006527 [Apiospora marii]|uniref:Heterokaryon incompatibility domain-containing protein n=1 Tax=Apiospora marii TaxID=335849 RepID=A0ABR1RZU9_9PEZI
MGDATDKVQISVNDRPFSVTKNLEITLRHLRLENRNRVLWADALCINQSDVSEVSTHVQRMWAIYENASRVVVFLGPRAEGSDEAIGLLSELSEMHIGTEHHHLITAMLDDPRRAESWQRLLRLMQRPWWMRAWVIQEYAVARQVVFVCGTAELPNEDFGKALQVLIDYKFNGLLRPDHHRLIRHIANTPINHMWSTRQAYQTSEPGCRPDLAAVVYRFRGHQALDPRDKIYSLYKLIEESPRLAPDYTRSVVDLYKDVAEVMMETSGTLEVLSHHNRNIQGGIEGLPTWCPDWTVLRGKRILLWPNGYRAAGRLLHESSFFRIENNTLRLRGKIVGRVKWRHGFESEDFDSQEGIYRAIQHIESVARQMINPDDDGAFDDAFRRTLVAARVRMKGPSREAKVLGPNAADALWLAWSSQMQRQPCDTALAKRYNDALYSALSGRAFVVAEGGAMGLVDGTVRVGDVICVFSRGRVPLALRPTEPSPTSNSAPKRYELVGEW